MQDVDGGMGRAREPPRACRCSSATSSATRPSKKGMRSERVLQAFQSMIEGPFLRT